jgi:hypothetical protein
MPNANRLTVGIMAMVAEEERRMIGARTKAALAAKRQFYAGLTDEQRAELAAQGKATSLGGYRGQTPTAEHRAASGEALRAKAKAQAERLAPTLGELQEAGVTSATGLAKALTEKGIPTPRGGETWTATQVQRVLARLNA